MTGARSTAVHSIPETQFSEWARQLREGDVAAGAALFKATYPALFRYARSLLHEEEPSRDVVQEAFVRLWTRRETLDPDNSLRGLLYLTVRNLAFNQMRDAAKTEAWQPTEDAASLQPTADEHAQAHLLGVRIRAWIDEMPTRRREAFQLSRFHGLSYQEIAGLMGLSVKTIENHIRLALQHLRSRIHAYEPSILKP